MAASTFKKLQWRNPQNQFIKKSLEGLEDTQFLSADDLQFGQLHNLREVVNYCYVNVPYYRNILKDLFQQDFDFSDFANLPPLRKDQIKDNVSALIPNKFKTPEARYTLGKFTTSGSTGTPMIVYRTIHNVLFTQALSLRYHLWQQRDLSLTNANIVTTKEDPPEKVASWAANLKTGDGYIIDISSNSRDIFDRLLDIQPHYIQTHPSTLKRLIDISLERGEKLTHLKEVRTFGELVEPLIQKKCIEHWQVAMADNYSCEEMGSMAFQCKGKSHYHVQIENVLIEIVDQDGKPCKSGEIGRVLVTQLKNLGMPLLKYELGDMARWSLTGNCDCGRNHPIIESIEGRIRNLVKLPSGDTFHPVFDEEPLLAIASVKQYQFTQKSLESIEVALVCEQKLNAEQEKSFARELNKMFKHDFKYHFNYQNEITLGHRNKFEIFRTEI